jgi:hypothetical protein
MRLRRLMAWVAILGILLALATWPERTRRRARATIRSNATTPFPWHPEARDPLGLGPPGPDAVEE